MLFTHGPQLTDTLWFYLHSLLQSDSALIGYGAATWRSTFHISMAKVSTILTTMYVYFNDFMFQRLVFILYVVCCTVGWVDIGTEAKVPLNVVVYLKKVGKIK
jgi:hypothetical protein